MPRVYQSRDAAFDLLGILTFIARDNVDAARRWRKTMSRVFRLLARHPLSGEAFQSTRWGLVRRHVHGNYVTYFRPTSDGIVILRVFHGAKDHETEVR